MIEHALIVVAAILAIGVGVQWLAWRFHLPAILLLLLAGFAAGPVAGLVEPEELLGDLFDPLVRASVGIVLFEGGLSLNWRESKGTRLIVLRLVTIGAAVTMAISALAARTVVGVDLSIALLAGAIMTVTGPTVIGPLLRNVRPKGRVGPILRWEGILIDPVGAVLAVLVFEAIILGEPGQAPSAIAAGVARTFAVGSGVGLFAAAVMVLVLKRYMIPDFLHNAVSLTLVIGAFTAADELAPEAGLVAVTVMGIALANQRFTPVRHIIEFKETLRVLLLSGLFILLAARLELDGIRALGWGGLLFLLIVLGTRFAGVWASVIGSTLTTRERLFLSAVAPRGIVAAAVSSVFALRLQAEAHPDAELLAPLIFTVIVGSIVIYSLVAPWLARRLDLSDPSPHGVLIVGAHELARDIGAALKEEGLPVILVDTDRDNIKAADMRGLTTKYRSILAEEVATQMELTGIGRLLAMTQNDELNSLAVQHYLHLFGRAETYQVAPAKHDRPREAPLAFHQYGRLLFSRDATFDELMTRFQAGATIRRTSITDEFGIDAFRERYGDDAILLFVVPSNGKLIVVTAETRAAVRPGDKLIALIDPGTESDRRGQVAGEEPAGARG